MRSASTIAAVAAAATAVSAQSNSTMSNSTMSGNSTGRPADMPMCDYYANAVLMENNATTQYTLLTVLVNTALIGNYSGPSANESVVPTGILNNGTTSSGAEVSLLKYFDGMLASTNRGGESGVSVNFLDGGGATPLMNNTASNNTDSRQHRLLTHLYSYFGALLNCSTYSEDGFPAYSGSGSQYNVHKFMDLSLDEVTYFIEQVGAAAQSLGVTYEDATAVGGALNMIFNNKCSPRQTVIPAQGPQLQAICIADDCPTAANSSCALYNGTVSREPSPSNSSNVDNSTPTPNSGSGGSGGSGSGSSDSGSGSSDTGAAASSSIVGALLLGAAGIVALAAGL